ncbi:hypothetical protein RchiOBHm_Chr7g0193861 [Rosa chinensis]|uniref:Uncharacterized protein n=1 Tax=Rosa chinensis TaxID=74649 RepID=A0A2P6P5X7_ROSCH|nr:hypothetical protein RchiOBHm_Chr7g0193861 [Rosa chinensis]
MTTYFFAHMDDKLLDAICECLNPSSHPIEAFAFQAGDLKYVASQFKRLQSKKLLHAFRYYSHQWRTSVCFIQVVWR